MSPWLMGATPEGPFGLALIALHLGAYGAFTWAFGLGCASLRRGESEAAFQKRTLRWIRVGFLMLTAGLVTHCTWTTFAWGEFWAPDPARGFGMVVWLAYAGALHMHHVPSLKGRRTILASLVAWGLLVIILLGVNLRAGLGSDSYFNGTLFPSSHASHPGS